MNTLKSLYKKLWTSLIRPERQWYSSHSLGSAIQIYEHSSAKRLDFCLRNAFDEDIFVSVFFACNEEGKPNPANVYVIYCHTHAASRVEGLPLLPWLIEKGIGLVVFDFRANGIGSGRWVTLGFKESSDVSVVVRFVKTELKAKRICIWGRSMGAASCLFFLSSSFRNYFNRKFPKKVEAGRSKTNQDLKVDFAKFEEQQARESFYQKKDVTMVCSDFEWSDIDWVDCFVSDASMLELRKTIISLVKSRNGAIPEWLIKAATAVIDKEIKKKTSISVDDIAPVKFAHSISTPGILVVGGSVCSSNDRLEGRNGGRGVLLQTLQDVGKSVQASQSVRRESRG